MATLIGLLNVVLALWLAVHFHRKGVTRTQGVLGGVCEGIAPHLNISPRLARVIAVVLLFTPLAGTVFLAYIILWASLEQR